MKKRNWINVVFVLAMCLFVFSCNVPDTDDQTGPNTGEPGGGGPDTGEPGGGGPDTGEPGGEVIEPPGGGVIVSGDVTIIESRGWLETLYVKWNKLAGAARYNVYYKGGAVSDWIKIDDPLIREYGTYFRADIPGLAAGSYQVKVNYEDDTGAQGENPATASVAVIAHDRSGFAFEDGAVPGAYKMDGTPKDGARVLYITEQNKETVKLRIINNTNNRDDEFTGLQNILTAYEKGYESRPLIIRFIGKINEKRGLPFTDNEGTVMIKGNDNRPLAMNITLEGIGDDATAYGWGIRTSRANFVEIRNIGFMLANTSQKDAVELQKSENMWVHNCDFFYMQKGSASDQKKGDGTLDIKECDLVTVSYNHFWDAGKTNLLGNGTETAGHLTYHHNWYDHSDSRNPRVRCHLVHVYNNYFDGVAKYGIGAAMGSSIFAEGNYFRNTKNPMLISMQGTDTKSGADEGNGTFSKEDGGMIKAYNNYMDAQSLANYKPWSSSNQIHFDAYEVTSAGDPVPSSVTAKKGGSTYNNTFLTYTYTADSPQTAKDNVTTYAGRYWGGDFSFTFNNATDDAKSDDPMPELLSKLNAYTSGLVGIQDEGDEGSGGDPDPGTEPNPEPIEGQVTCSFDMTTSKGESVFAKNSAFTLTSANGTKPSGGKTIAGVSYDVALKLESDTVITFTISAAMTLKLYTDASANKNVKVDDVNVKTDANGELSLALTAGTHTIKKGDSMNLWLIVLTPAQ
jgi:pectate lyase